MPTIPLKRWLLYPALVLAASACQSAVQQTPATAPPATVGTTATPVRATPTTIPVNDTIAQAGCTVVSQIPAPDPAAEPLFPPLEESDWVQGPASAAVTIIEYGDFQ